MLPVMALGAIKNWKIILGGALALALVTIIGVSYFHYSSLLTEVSDLKVANSQIETKAALQQAEIKAQEDAIEAWVQSQKDLQEKLKELQNVAENAQKEGKRLNDLFGKHEFGELAKKKPGLIQKRVNAGTAAMFKLLSCTTGDGSACKENSPTN